MSKIKVMSEDLTNKIAAGEVVERIANVVKELVENSLDAGAKVIKVDLVGSGTSLIKITDDGAGMDELDAISAFQRHATSKIYKSDDLFFINTLGFRGEALPSIASVSKVTLLTSEGNIGTKIVIHGGKLITKTKGDARKGTMISVEDLFYNTPARLKYLKSEQTELANTASYIEKIALSYPEVSFYLSNNGNQIIKTSGTGNLLKTIHEIYGLDVSKNMLNIKSSDNDYDISGFISKPSILKSNRNFITTIVNGRVVRNAELNKVINDAYYTYKPDIKFPIVVLIIETDPTLIDVNIHPTKQDIKFSKMEELKNLVLSSIKNTIYNALLIPKVEVKTIENQNEIPIMMANNDFKVHEPSVIYNQGKTVSFKEEQRILNELLEPTDTQEQMDFKTSKNEEMKTLELYPCGLVMGTYIVAQNDEGMYLIDAHAAQERINYERILKAFSSKQIQTIDLLIPINMELSSSDYLKFNEHKNILLDMGFIIEEFGINTISIKTHPTWLITGYEEESIRRLIEMVIELPNDFDIIRFQDSVAATMACKVSIKGNTRITENQMESIINSLVLCDNPYNCPHGRPTIITFTKYELEKMFKRVMN